MRASTLFLTAAVMQLLGPRPAFVRTAYAEPDKTPIADVVIYGIDADTNELLRYTFDTATFTVIGVVKTADGQKVENTEALTWVPSGPAKGMYCIPRDGSLGGKLLKINPLDASAQVVCDSPWDDIVGMVTMRMDAGWVILAWDHNDRELVYIDPVAPTLASGFSADVELEGFVVMTQLTDPYGHVVVDACG
jgi:hypothetical protein